MPKPFVNYCFALLSTCTLSLLSWTCYSAGCPSNRQGYLPMIMHKLTLYFSSFTLILLFTGVISDPGYVSLETAEAKTLIKGPEAKSEGRYCKHCKNNVRQPSFHSSLLGNCVSVANNLHFYVSLLTAHILLVYLSSMFLWMSLWNVRIWSTFGLCVAVMLEGSLVVYSSSLPSLKALETE